MRPNIKIVKLTDIVPVMDFSDKKVDYLRQNIAQSGSIRNLFYLAPLGSKKYLLLEDSAILEAVRQLHIEFVPAQIVTFRKRRKISGMLPINGLDHSAIVGFQTLFPRSFSFGANEIERADFRRNVIINCRHSNSSVDDILLFKRIGAGKISPAVFNFFDYLKNRCFFGDNMIGSSTKLINLKKRPGDGLIKVTDLTRDDLLFALEHGFLFPAGLLRFEYGMRIMGIDYPLNVLRDRAPIREKERFLYDLMDLRLNSGYSNYIGDGVYLLSY